MTHQISIAQANELIARFLANKQDILNGAFADIDIFSNSQTFKISSVLTLLGQSGTTGLRAYFGMYDNDSSVSADKRNKIVLVLCSSDVNENDLGLSPTADGSNVIILQDAQICPPVCSATSQINNL